MIQKAQCEGHVPSDDWGRYYRCSNLATCVEEGKSYCHLHAPSKVAERRAKREATISAKMNAAWEDGVRIAAQHANDRRKLALFDDLVAACSAAKAFLDSLPMSLTDSGLSMRLHELIARAESGQIPAQESHDQTHDAR